MIKIVLEIYTVMVNTSLEHLSNNLIAYGNINTRFATRIDTHSYMYL